MSATTILQYASGLFANRSWQRAWGALKPAAAPTLALLGNVVSVADEVAAEQSYQFLTRAARAWDRVLLVPGPLEFGATKLVPTPYVYQADRLRALLGAAGAGRCLFLDQGELVMPRYNAVLLGAYGGPSIETADEIDAAWPESHIWTAAGGTAAPMTVAELDHLRSSDLDWLRERTQWYARHRPDLRTIVLTHSLCSPLLQGRGPARRIDVLPAHLVAHACSPRTPAWLCGAGATSVSGLVAPTLFAAVNGAACWKGWQQNPHFMSDRVLSLPLN
jgi:hypothetical protein